MKMKLILTVLMSLALTNVCFAEKKAMSNDKVREMMIDASKRSFVCPPDDETNAEGTTEGSAEKSSSSTRIQKFETPSGETIINKSEIKAQNPTNNSATAMVNNRCTCLCPEDSDIQGKCGDRSLYIRIKNDTQRPKCYPKDIQDWEVSDYREKFDIPAVDIP
jgi:hypothetical protein